MITYHHHSDRQLWCKIGVYFASREIRAELGGPMSSDEGYHWWVAEEKGQVVGFGALEMKKSSAWLRHSYVFKANRNNGVYGKLLAERIKFAHQNGDVLKHITCVATAESLPSLLKVGFVITTERGKYKTLEMAL